LSIKKLCAPSQKIATKRKIAQDAMIFIKNVAFILTTLINKLQNKEQEF